MTPELSTPETSASTVPTGAVEAALAALESAGVPRSNVLLGFFTDDTSSPGDLEYKGHLGAIHGRDEALALEHLARELSKLANVQTMAVFSPEHCPACDSDRYGPQQKVNEDYRVYGWSECLDCHHFDGEKPHERP